MLLLPGSECVRRSSVTRRFCRTVVSTVLDQIKPEQPRSDQNRPEEMRANWIRTRTELQHDIIVDLRVLNRGEGEDC